MAKDYYQVLGVSKKASEKEIRAAYRRLARKYHPDVNRGDSQTEGKFKEINDAYHVLSNTDRRRNYDQFGEQWQHADRFKRGGNTASPFTWFSQSEGRRRTAGANFGTGFGGVGDIFKDLFAGGTTSPSGRYTATKATRPEVRATISLEEAYGGTNRIITLPNNPSGAAADRRLEVLIPAGVDSGSRVHIRAPQGGSNGSDIYLRITVSQHPQFERQGNDLKARVQIPITVAVLGGEVEVPRIKGTPLALVVPPGTQNGKVFRLKGQGMPHGVSKGAEGFGDMLVVVELELPSHISDEERDLFRKLRDLRAE